MAGVFRFTRRTVPYGVRMSRTARWLCSVILPALNSLTPAPSPPPDNGAPWQEVALLPLSMAVHPAAMPYPAAMAMLQFPAVFMSMAVHPAAVAML